MIGALFAILLLWPAALNRGAFLFSDTPTYVRGADAAIYRLTGHASPWSKELFARYPRAAAGSPEIAQHAPVTRSPDEVVLAGRSIYYGVLLYGASMLGDFWAMIIFQSVVTAAAALLAARRLAGPSVPVKRLALILLVPLVSAGGFFTSFMMPDIFAALGLLSTAVIGLWWRRLGGGERAFWLALLSISLLSHSATVLIVGAVVLLLAVAHLLLHGPSLTLAPILFGIALALGGEALFTLGVERATGHAPVRPPFLAARLIDDGPGLAWLREHCPQRPGLVLCDALGRLPVRSDPFLWSKSGGVFSSMAPEDQRRLAAEEGRFIRAVIADRPLEVFATTVASFLDQLGRYRVGPEFGTGTVVPAKLPAAIAESYSGTAAARGDTPVAWTDALALPVLGFSLGVICALLWRRRHERDWAGERRWFAGAIVAGLLVNALVCGAISTPHDRYQVRLLWLLPLIALSFAAAGSRRPRTMPASI